MSDGCNRRSGAFWISFDSLQYSRSLLQILWIFGGRFFKLRDVRDFYPVKSFFTKQQDLWLILYSHNRIRTSFYIVSLLSSSCITIGRWLTLPSDVFLVQIFLTGSQPPPTNAVLVQFFNRTLAVRFQKITSTYNKYGCDSRKQSQDCSPWKPNNNVTTQPMGSCGMHIKGRIRLRLVMTSSSRGGY